MSVNNRLFFAVLILFLIPLASALSFYDGGVSVSSINSNIEVKSESIEVHSIYVLNNLGNKNESIVLNFPAYPSDAIIQEEGKEFKGKLNIEVEQSKKIEVYYSLPYSSSLLLNPEVLFDNSIIDSKVDFYQVSLHFSNPSISITSSSVPLVNNNQDYIYGASGIYPSSFSAKWSDISISLKRYANEELGVGDLLNVELEISNTGEKTEENLELQDTFLFANFEPVGDSFTLVSSSFDPYYKWIQKFSLAPGENKKYSYSLKVKQGNNLRLNPLVVMREGKILYSIEGKSISILPQIVEITNQTSIDVLSYPSINGNSILSNLSDALFDYKEIKTKIKSYKWIITLIVILLLISIGSVGYILYRNIQRNKGMIS